MSISSLDYDALRAAHPDLRISVYGMTPGSVTLEIITPDDAVFPFVAATLAEAIALAFPEEAPRYEWKELNVSIEVDPDLPPFNLDELKAPVSDLTPDADIFS